MEQIDARVKKWGNSYGIIIPIEIVNKEKLKEGVEITITLNSKKLTNVGDLMELARRLNLSRKLQKIDTEKALKKVEEAFWGD